MRKLFIVIKTNNQLISLEEYSATLVGNSFEPASPTINSLQSSRGIRQIVDENYTFNPDNASLQFLIEAKDHNQVDYLVHKLLGDLIKFEFKLSSQNYWRTFIQTSVELKWLNYENRAVVTLRGSSYCWGQEKYAKIIKEEQVIFIDSPRPTPIRFEIKAKENITDLTINNIRIKSLSAGETMIIDSYDCKVTVNGNNAIQRVELYDFPIAKNDYQVTTSDISNIDLYIKWKARL